MIDLGSVLPAGSLGIEHVSDEPGRLIIPFARNTNDKGTVFAGSIFCLAALSGYETAFERQRALSLSGDLFLLSSNITYHRPGLSDLGARSRIIEDFVVTKRGNFKMQVGVEIFDTEKDYLCATFEGAYVVRTDAR